MNRLTRLDPSGTLPTGEPALSQLCDLTADALDTLVRAWLAEYKLHTVRLIAHSALQRTYQAWLGDGPVRMPVHVRVYQRHNRLQSHHVDAFLGSLSRQGVAAGILVTTSGFSRSAERIAGDLPGRTLRLVSGPEWASELAVRKLGIRSRVLRGWLLDLTRSPFVVPCRLRGRRG